MAHYFTREEAEALLPQISIVLREIQIRHKSLLRTQEELGALRMQAAGNGYHLHERMMTLQEEIPRQAQSLRKLLNELGGFESGLLAHWAGPVFSVVFGGVGTVLVVLIVALGWPEIRRFGRLDASEA